MNWTLNELDIDSVLWTRSAMLVSGLHPARFVEGTTQHQQLSSARCNRLMGRLMPQLVCVVTSLDTA